MANVLSAGENTLELHMVQLELEAMEKQIHDLLENQAKLQEQRTALETSRADGQKYAVSFPHDVNTPSLLGARAPRM